jgi:hypothetical protein
VDQEDEGDKEEGGEDVEREKGGFWFEFYLLVCGCAIGERYIFPEETSIHLIETTRDALKK